VYTIVIESALPEISCGGMVSLNSAGQPVRPSLEMLRGYTSKPTMRLVPSNVASSLL